MIRKYTNSVLDEVTFLGYLNMNDIRYFPLPNAENNKNIYLVYTDAEVAVMIAFKNKDLKAISVYRNKSYVPCIAHKGNRDMFPEELVFILLLTEYKKS